MSITKDSVEYQQLRHVPSDVAMPVSATAGTGAEP